LVAHQKTLDIVDKPSLTSLAILVEDYSCKIGNEDFFIYFNVISDLLGSAILYPMDIIYLFEQH